MPYVKRDASGAITGTYANPQPGYAVEWLADNDPAVVTFLGVCAFRILWIFTMFAAYHTLEWLYVSYPISWALTAAAHYVCYFCIRQKAYRKDALRRCAA